MSQGEFLVFYLCVLVVILACRCVPLLALKGRALSPRVSDALSLIPPAAFAALVANDLFDPVAGISVPGVAAALVVALVARRTGSLIWCALVGMAAYAALGLVA
ncbi:MAG TPA: AzlD domain-containing protein [Candidatus Olsenella pullistercoris]|uniref:AzlD domain-containing protein n=1 Tax=Candidatus Olsenella pullistercoris TaxID=2838712 RepID=A0A9D2EYP8_9ACTN|nr:AzlD domain-containing protein [Candidatus Olsenella pullistercoris]